jgi:hypothetical protein
MRNLRNASLNVFGLTMGGEVLVIRVADSKRTERV